MPVSTFRSLQTDSRDSFAETRRLLAYSCYRSFSTNGAASVLSVRAATSCCKIVQAMTAEACGVRNSPRILTRRQKGGPWSTTEQNRRCASRSAKNSFSVVLHGPPFYLRVRILAYVPHPRRPRTRRRGSAMLGMSVLQLRHHCRDACTGCLVKTRWPNDAFANAHAGVC